MSQDITHSSNQNQKENDDQKNEKKKTKKVKRFKAKKKAVKNFDLTNLQNSKMKEYNALRDTNLSSYFTSEQRRHHLQNVGLITEKGYIINKPEEYLKKKDLYQKIYEKQIKQEALNDQKIQNEFTYNPYTNTKSKSKKKVQAT